MKRIVLYSMTIVIFMLNAVYVPAAQIRGINFSDSVIVGDEVLPIRGGGLLKWLFFDVYVVALYLEPEVPGWNALGDVPKRMEFHYLSDMRAEQFVQSGEPLLLRNASQEELSRIREKINAINNMYRDVQEGERYSLTYIPGEGTELALNGEALGRIDGYDFAAIYFRIWLGENPVDDDLKAMLLNSSGQKISLH